MPEENGNLLPGEPGYVPVETVETSVEQPKGEVSTILPPAETKQDEPEEAVDTVVEETTPVVSQDKYNQLLAAYTKLKQRVGLDIVYEKQLDNEAGL